MGVFNGGGSGGGDVVGYMLGKPFSFFWESDLVLWWWFLVSREL